MPSQTLKPYEIVVLVTPHFNMMATVGFLDAFRAANYLEGQSLFRWLLVSEGGGMCQASNGLHVETLALNEQENASPDLVMISSSWTPEANRSTRLRTALWWWAQKGVTLGGLDTGAFVLAEAGLLNGRRATVHYEHFGSFEEMYPECTLSEELFVYDKQRISCCGGSASVDFALGLISELQGADLANAAARYLFHQSLRQPATRQNPGLSEPLGRGAPQVLQQALSLMERNLETPLAIAELSVRVGASQRHLERIFREHTGKTPKIAYRDMRLDRARGLVTQTEMSLAQAGLAAGFSNPTYFSRTYRARFGLSPREDRVEGRVPFEFRAWPMHRGST